MLPNIQITFIAGLLSGFFSLLAYLVYIWSIKKGVSKPRPATWLIWSMISTISFLSMYFSGSTNTLWMPAVYSFTSSYVLLLSLKNQGFDFNLFDKVCITLALLSILVWFVTSNPFYSLLISLFVNFLGALPTIRKLLLNQGGEDRLAWLFVTIGSVFNVFAVTSYTIEELVYPVYMLKINAIIFFIIIFMSSKKKLENK